MKTGIKILIASGCILAVGGIAYAASPALRRKISGAVPELTLHQKVQRAINSIISNKTFVSSEFIDTAYNYGNEGAQEFIFNMANKELKLTGETWSDFNFEGLGIINDYYITHWHLQYQITRIMQSDDYADYREQLRDHYRISSNFTSTATILTGIFQNAIDDTQRNPAFAGAMNDYWYHPVDSVDPFAGVSDVSWDQPDTIAWYKKFFMGGHGSTGVHGGGPGNVGSTSGGGQSSGGTSGGGVNINGNEVIGWVQNAWCKVFPDMCSTPDPTDCGYGSIYDAETNSCIPDPAFDENDPNYNPCGEGSHLENNQCVPDDIAECPEGWHNENGVCYPDDNNETPDCGEGSIYDPSTDSCIEF
jgi:uncharacterized membrane protein YgcG